MDTPQVLIGIIVVGFIAIFYFINRKLSQLQKPKDDGALMEWLKSMHISLETTNKTINEALRTSSKDMTHVLQENSKQLNERLDKAATVIRDVGKEVGQMSEIGRGIKELQEFLKSPKLRGNIGEQILKDLISQMLPKNSFHLQYQFRSGEKVDAAIQTDAGILCIDAKFPLENFQRMLKSQNEEEKEVARKEFLRDVKKHVDAIAKKYILPEEGTMDFSLMYIPSETIYYEIINSEEILEYARKSRVYLVSPNTLYTHLQTILLSFEGRKIESKSKEVFQLLRALQIDYEKVEENLTLLGKHLTNASSQYHYVATGVSRFGQKLSSVQTIGDKEEKKALD